MNIPRYAAGLRLMPGARCNDGLLDACLFPGGSLLHGLRYLSGILRNRHQQGTDCQRLSAERIRIESEREVPYQLDGDPGGLLPVEISVIPGRVPCWSRRRGPASTDFGTQRGRTRHMAVTENPITVGPYRCGTGTRCW